MCHVVKSVRQMSLAIHVFAQLYRDKEEKEEARLEHALLFLRAVLS